MTTPLNHPPAEDLGRFIEGTLDEAARLSIVEHIAGCDDCRITVVDVTEFEKPASASTSFGQRWWAAAAAVLLVVAAAPFVWDAQHPLAPLIEEYARQSSRPVEGRLNGFPHVVRGGVMRGGSENFDPALAQLAAKAAEVLERRGENAKMQHAKGVAELLLVEAELPRYITDTEEDRRERARLIDQRNEAITMLQKAANSAPENAAFQSDLAAVLIAKGDTNSLDLAVSACDQALKIEPRSPDALFNRALALRDPAKAKAAYQHYLDVDPSPPWANEARQAIARLE